ncbi:MAG: hypothetical protein JNK72_26445 [Myxococcales bacterium]|nr:hypothetical protein [Myxococcales bacterium]
MRPHALILIASLALGCGDDGGDGAANEAALRAARCQPSNTTRSAVIARFGFVRPAMNNAAVAEGLNLDNRVSTSGDSLGCRQADFTSPTGEAGIDNQLARLLPVVDAMTGGAFDGAIQGAVNNGQLLVGISLEGIDDPQNDPCVTLAFTRVSGSPFVDSNMLLDKGQTYELQRDRPVTRVSAALRNGVVTAGPFLLPLPITVLDANFVLNLHQAQIRATLREDGSLEGVIGGGISVSEFSDQVRTLTISQTEMNTITGALRVFADLAPENGRCQQISAGIRFLAREAFLQP